MLAHRFGCTFFSLLVGYKRHERNSVGVNKFWDYRKVKFDPTPLFGHTHTHTICVVRWPNRNTIYGLLTISIFSNVSVLDFGIVFILVLISFQYGVFLRALSNFIGVRRSICMATRHFYILAFGNHRDIIHLCPVVRWLMWRRPVRHVPCGINELRMPMTNVAATVSFVKTNKTF